MTTINYKTLSGTCRPSVDVLEQAKQGSSLQSSEEDRRESQSAWTRRLYQMAEVNFNQTRLSRTANQRRAEEKGPGSVTPLAYLLRGRSRLPHAREHVAAIDLKPSLSSYNFSIICRTSSLLFPSFFCNRPSSSSSLPSENTKSSSVRFPYCCLSLPFSSFHEPLIWSLFIKG